MNDKVHHGHKWMPVMYGTFYGLMQAAAQKHGYALALHGSLTRDMDLVAVPWTQAASPALALLAELFAVIGWTGSDDEKPYHGEAEQKPHGRTAYIIHTGGGGYVDISIMPILAAPKGASLPCLASCHADRDGDCSAAGCPQLRDNEPHATGRSCPLPDPHDDDD